MSSKKKKAFSKPPQPTESSSELQERLSSFRAGGRAASAPSAPAPTQAPPTSKRGRPALEEDTRRTTLALRRADIQSLEELALRWKRETDSDASVKVTAIVRSLVAVAMPILEGLSSIEDEASLREHLQALLQDQTT